MQVKEILSTVSNFIFIDYETLTSTLNLQFEPLFIH